MKGLVLCIFLFAGLSVFAQDFSEWHTDYYGSNKTWYSNRLIIDVDDSTTGVYYLRNNLISVMVDSNWTSSGMGFQVYNPLEDSWELLCNSSDSIIVVPVTVGRPININPLDFAGVKEVKFAKINTSTGAYVKEATTAGKIVVVTRKY